MAYVAFGIYGLTDEEQTEMSKIKELEAQLAEVKAQASAIVALADQEKREVTEQEQTEIYGLVGKDAEDKTCELSKIQAQIDYRKRIAAIAAEKVGKEVDEAFGSPSRIVIPASAKRHNYDKRCFDSAEDAYKVGNFYAAALFGSEKSRQFCNDHGMQIVASQSEGDNRKGGVFVPLEVETSIIRLVEQYGVMRRSCMVVPMSSDRKVKPVRVSGLTAYPAAESNTANQATNTTTETDVDYNNVELVARKWKVVARISDELNEDALISMANEISVEAALAFAYAEDNAGFNGDGTSTYHGIVGLKNSVAAGSIYDCISGNTGFTTLDLEDFEYALAKLPDYANLNPAWYISKAGYYASMARLQMAAGGNTVTNVAGAPELRFLGLPVVWSPVLPTTLAAQTSTIVAYVGDLREGCLFGDRRGMEMRADASRYFDVDQIAIKASERFDFVNHSKGDATNPGVVVAVKTASS